MKMNIQLLTYLETELARASKKMFHTRKLARERQHDYKRLL